VTAHEHCPACQHVLLWANGTLVCGARDCHGTATAQRRQHHSTDSGDGADICPTSADMETAQTSAEPGRGAWKQAAVRSQARARGGAA
jgi:hypothetical protein